MTGYCDFAPGHPLHGPYHDREYGFPVEAESVLFERLVLEINQAGLSWELMLKKRANFHAPYEGHDLDRVPAYGAPERARLLADAGIIRNRLKVDAVIENARRVRARLSGRRQDRRPRPGLDAGRPRREKKVASPIMSLPSPNRLGSLLREGFSAPRTASRRFLPKLGPCFIFAWII